MYEEDSGLYYYRHRYYDPGLGRFVSRDPLGIWGDVSNLGNGENYAGNDPVNRVDPLGQRSCSTGFGDGIQAGLDELGESINGLLEPDISQLDAEAILHAVIGSLRGAAVVTGLGESMLKKLVPGPMIADLLVMTLTQP